MHVPHRRVDDEHDVAAHVLVLAKEPVAGRVKTRLSPVLTDAQCAEVATACLSATLRAVSATRGVARTLVLDGAAGPWLPDGFTVLPQRGRGLGERLAAAFQDAWALHRLPMLLVGMDTPQLTPRLLQDALTTLDTPGTEAVLGQAQDGGWWALGLSEPQPGAFDGVPMSTCRAGRVQAERLAALGRPASALPVLQDIDEVADLVTVSARLPPTSELRRLVHRLGLVPVGTAGQGVGVAVR